jgi:hypothetical protein
MGAQPDRDPPPSLSAADLISNRALREDDSDDFGYGAIAGRVAETILVLEPPLTIGLFGPWGSGKTSMYELLRRELKAKDKKTRLAYYDASTYGGEALKRNFISHIAAELGYDAEKYPEFHRGLYESRRRTEIDFEAVKDKLRPIASLLALLYFGFLLIFCVLVGITSIGTKENFFGQIGETLPQLIAPTAVGGLVIAVVGLLMKGATIDADQSKPASDEAFAKCFGDLIEQGRKDHKFKRLVVFVDELDRCSSEDVVSTLTAIRTFLTQKHAVFVVAADRAALERALDEKLPQPTPVNQEDPYYSSASSFFDKIFHDRVPLPPLRGPRLYEWAFEKVKTREGYWAELRDESDRELRDILYFLIPSHVRAPRRVKVLLNSFIRSVAIAAHSDLDWKGRAREIAKLTALDTEFTLLGADLRIEPRLPELLLAPPDSPSERLVRLLDKHGGYQISRGPQKEGEESKEPTDQQKEAEEPSDQILADATPQQRRALTHVEHEQLRRYLGRTRDVRIGRDLLFLDRAGAAVGIDDVELDNLLDQAVDVPADVIEALEARDADTRSLAARVLADMAEREFGEERRNVMTALMGVVELLGSDVDQVAGDIVGSVQSFARDEELAPEHLVGALTLSLSSAASKHFQASILADERLFTDSGRLTQVCKMLDRIPSEQRETVYGAIAAIIAGDGSDFISVLHDVPDTELAEVLESAPVYDALFRYLGPEAETPGENDGLAEQIYELAASHGDNGAPLRKAMHDLLLKEEITYGPFKAHAAEVFSESQDLEERDREVLLALVRFHYRDSEFWTEFLSSGEYSSSHHGYLAVGVITDSLAGVHQLSLEEVDAKLATIEAVVPFAKMADAGEVAQVRDALAAELAAAPWWSDEVSRQRQQRLHHLTHELADLDESFSEGEGQMLINDLSRSFVDPSLVNEETWKGLVEMGGELGPGAATLLVALEPVEPLISQFPLWLFRVRASLAATARVAGAEVDADVIPDETILQAAAENAPHADDGIADWLLLSPSADLVGQGIEALGERAPAVVLTSFESWAKATSKEERTSLAKQLVDLGHETSRWMNALVDAGIDETSLVEHVSGLIRSAARGDRREELMAALVHIRPVSSPAQKAIADLIIELVGTEKQVDFKAATKAIPALGKDHRSAGRLRQAFQAAADSKGHQLSERAAIQLAEAGVKVPKKAVKKNAWGRFKDFFS